MQLVPPCVLLRIRIVLKGAKDKLAKAISTKAEAIQDFNMSKDFSNLTLEFFISGFEEYFKQASAKCPDLDFSKF
ncbi:unnamed protein product [Ilex paraguariensis]|uniref:Uncharacterized protein n=1 Tax=Ilex paraguariensis TaxID=185542 RepID=A0ABC8RGN1_9AQUA